MLRDDQAVVAGLDAPLFPPAPVIYTGLGLTAAGWLWIMAVSPSALAVGVILLALGLVAVGAGLAAHLSAAHQDGDGRLQTAGWWLIAAAAAFVGGHALEGPADSMALLLRAFALVGVVAALLSVLAPPWRWLGLSLLLAWHFFALFTATTNIDPISGPRPWLATQVWTRVTRPYLQFVHLNNAYHFYAPEPGPVALLWFRVRFADGAAVWVRMPDHAKCANHVERRRMASLASTLSQSRQVAPTEEQVNLRDEAAQRYDPPVPPRSQAGPGEGQYRDPGYLGRMLLTSVTRHLARTTPHPGGAKAPAVAVRCYQGECGNPPVEDFAEGLDPLDPTLYRVWYLGEYDGEGNLDESSRKDMLYWGIPIIRRPPPTAPPEVEHFDPSRRRVVSPERWSGEGPVLNFLRIHAGDGNKEEMP